MNKPSNMPHKVLQAVRDAHRNDPLNQSIEDTIATYNVFRDEEDLDPLVAAILTHCALSNELIDGVNS